MTVGDERAIGMASDSGPLVPAGSPAPSARRTGFVLFCFFGGFNDPEGDPDDGPKAAIDAAQTREGKSLATYNLGHGPQGYRPLRDFLSVKLKRDAGMTCTADDIMLVSGSLQALDLVHGALLARGDTVICERDCYEGTLNRYSRLGVNVVGIPLDGDGMRMDALEAALADLKRNGVRPKFIYTIPTVQNPTATILTMERREKLLALADVYGVPIFEDDCYANLIWSVERPPALYAMSKSEYVIHVGSFSKSIAPALRVGFIVAPWSIMSRMLALKTDAGSGSVGQMALAEYCTPHFDEHVPELRKGLKSKLDTLVDALGEQFVTAAEFDYPSGCIFLWFKLP